MVIRRLGSEAEWIGAAVAELGEAVGRALAEGRRALALCLAGGATPEPVYRAMAALPLRGFEVDLWLGDERAVPEDDPARNGLMVARAFADCEWQPAPRLRPWPPTGGGAGLAAAAREYAAELVDSLGPAPAFDLAILGLGADGHAASLFPGSAALSEGELLAVATRAPVAPLDRLTLTYRALGASRSILFLVRGPGKLEALGRLEAADPALPATRLASRALVLCL
jgi:6-phosphogluconolactonase